MVDPVRLRRLLERLDDLRAFRTAAAGAVDADG